MRQISDETLAASPTAMWGNSSPLRLKAVTDPVSDQDMTIQYGGGASTVATLGYAIAHPLTDGNSPSRSIDSIWYSASPCRISPVP
jgi:hypothetical protein